MNSVEVAVVGRGLIGSAAARHLAESGLSTALIGPADPEDRSGSQGPFSSHDDEGRIVRIGDRDLIWSQLAGRSLARFPDIEQRSGIPFHAQRGLVVSRPDVEDWIDSGLMTGSNIHKITTEDLDRTTGITITNDHPVAYEGPPAGHINPRRLVAAQTKLTELAGGTVINDAVTSLDRVNGAFEISGSFGSLTASRILLATGPFGRDLLKGELALERRARTVLLAEMDAPTNLPSLIVADPPDYRLADVYWVPAVPYPDGNSYLKIGGQARHVLVLADDDELIEWFHSDGSKADVEALGVSLRSLLPDETFTSFTSRPCAVTMTTSGYPYLGWVEDDLAVAIGGNGLAAKSCDELGRLAASLFSPDGWVDNLDAEVFKPQLLT